MRGVALGVAAAVLVFGVASWALEPVPHAFEPETPIRASEINENFDHLVNAVGALERPASVLSPTSATSIVDVPFDEAAPVANLQAELTSTGGLVQVSLTGGDDGNLTRIRLIEGPGTGYVIFEVQEGCTGDWVRLNYQAVTTFNSQGSVGPGSFVATHGPVAGRRCYRVSAAADSGAVNLQNVRLLVREFP